VDVYWIRVRLENTGSREAHVIFKADFYDFLATSDEDVTKYRSVIDPYFGFFGVGLIVAAVIIEFWAWRGKWRISKPSTSKK